jgi:hypothetical protein
VECSKSESDRTQADVLQASIPNSETPWISKIVSSIGLFERSGRFEAAPVWFARSIKQCVATVISSFFSQHNIHTFTQQLLTTNTTATSYHKHQSFNPFPRIHIIIKIFLCESHQISQNGFFPSPALQRRLLFHSPLPFPQRI